MVTLPVAQWLPTYQRRFLRPDLIAGVSSWALVVPQAVAYGQIAGMPAQSGLASAFAGPLGYAALGTSRQLLVTPTSSSALVSASVVGGMAGGDAGRFVALTAVLAILTGIVLALLGVFKLGFVSQFLAYSVQIGFLFGLGLTILVTQLASVLGVPSSGGDFFPSLRSLLENLGGINGWTAALGLGGLAALLLLKRYAPSAPGALVVVLGGILLTAILGLDDRGVDVVGEIPRGLPVPALPDVRFSEIVDLLPAALALAVIGYAESASVAQDFANQHHYDIDPNQERVALGGASALTGVMQGFMVTGGASQSVANDRAGAKTQVAGLMVAALTLFTAFALTFLFINLPQAVLGAIVISAVLGKAPDEPIYQELSSHDGYRPVPGMLIVRQDGLLLFTNARTLRENVLAMSGAQSPLARVVLRDLEMSADLDIESADVLRELRDDLERSGTELWLCGVHARVRTMIERTGFAESDGEQRVLPDVARAVGAFGSGRRASSDWPDAARVEHVAIPRKE